MNRTQLPHQQVKPDPDGVDVKLLKSFAGAVDWATLADLGVLTESSEDARYVQKVGDSVPGAIDFTGQVPTASAAPAGSAGLTNRHYVDLASAAAVTAAEAADIPTSTYDARYAMLASAGAVTGKWDFSAQLPVASTQATGSAQLTNKLYVDTASAAALAAALAADITTSTYDARYVQLASAQAITGVKDFSAALPNASTQPTGSAQFANKIYVDTASAAALAAAKAADVTTATYDGRYAMLASAAAVTGKWDLSAMLPVASTQATGSAQLTNKIYVDTASAAAVAAAIAASVSTSTYDSRYVMLASAQAITGVKDFSAALPNASTQATGSAQLTNKLYVDNASAAALAAAIAADVTTTTYDSRYALKASAAAITGKWDFSAMLPVASTQATGSAQLTNKLYVDTASAAAVAAAIAAAVPTSTYDSRYVMLASAQAITGVKDFSAALPNASTQATGSAQLTNKIYVDTASAAALAAAKSADIPTSTYDGRYAMLASAGAITGRWDFSAMLPVASTQATGSAQLTNKIYVDSAIAASAVGFSMTQGDLRYVMLASAQAVTGIKDFSAALPTASTSPTGSAQFTNRQYVDNLIAASGYSMTNLDLRYVNASGDVMTGELKNGANFTASGSHFKSVNDSNYGLELWRYDTDAKPYFDIAGVNGEIEWTDRNNQSVAMAGAFSGSKGVVSVVSSSGGVTAASYVRASGYAFDPADLTTKKYVDDQVSAASGNAASLFVVKSGDAVSGLINFTGQSPTASASPAGSASLTNRQYVDTASAAAVAAAIAATVTTATYDSRYIMLASAQSIAGVKDFSAALPTASTSPTSSAQLVNRQYVDGLISASGHSTSDLDNSYVNVSGDTMTGSLIVDVTASSFISAFVRLDSVQQSYIDFKNTGISKWQIGRDGADKMFLYNAVLGVNAFTASANGDFYLSQGVGNVIISSAGVFQQSKLPTASSDVANKIYVDNAIATVSPTATDGGSSSASYIFTKDIDGGVANFNFITAKAINGGSA